MRAARFLAILILLAAIIAAALYLFRLPIASFAARQAMTGAGLERPEARVTALTLRGIRLENVSAGPPDREAFRFEQVEADYRWRALLLEREIDAVRAGPGRLRLSISDDGKLSVPGFNAGGGGEGGGGLPFSSLIVNEVDLYVDTPGGLAEGELSAEYDVGGGGSAVATLTTHGVGWKGVRIPSGEANTTLTLSVDGQATFAASFNGDIEAQGLSARNASLRIEGEGASWRDAANGAFDRATGKARIAFDAPEILFASATLPDGTSLAPIETAFGAQIHQAALAGELDAELTVEGFEVSLAPGASLSLATPDGAGLTLARSGGSPLYARKGAREAASFRFDLKSDGVNASGAVDAEREGGRLRVAAPLEIEEYTASDFAIAGSMVDFAATVEGDALTAEVAVKSGLKRAQIGRLALTDAPFSSAFRVDADLAAKTADIYNKDECIIFERGRGLLAEQNAEAVLGRTQLCNAEGPLAMISWAQDAVYSLKGEISSVSGRLRLGETRASGQPPNISFNAVYNPAENRTDIDGAVSNGAMTLNDAINLSAVLGRFDFSLDREAMRANGFVDRVRISQNAEKELVTPVIASGRVALTGDKTTFDYTLATPAGRALGTGAGTHDMATASGQTEFSFDGLQFTPGGLQPNELALSLKGIVSAAAGGLDGSIRFAWSSEGVTSDADFYLKNISFGGPTRAVTRTTGVNGALAFSDLLPVKTEGLQTVTIRSVDLDALQLKDGEVSFELPGDDTIYLSRGEFPWFGGTIGVYEATASLAGEARVPLRAENVDLGQLFKYVDVNGLSGEGLVTGTLPLVFEDGKARIDNGVLRSTGPGVIRYQGVASDRAAASGQGAKVAFDILRDLRYTSMQITVNGPLDGRLDFVAEVEGTGEVTVRDQTLIREGSGRVPVLYRISLDAALLELLRQARLSQDVKLQIIQGLEIVE